MDDVTKTLIAALELMLEVIPEPPEANCRCHIAAPCSDCVDHSGEREAFDFARSALEKAIEGKA